MLQPNTLPQAKRQMRPAANRTQVEVAQLKNENNQIKHAWHFKIQKKKETQNLKLL